MRECRFRRGARLAPRQPPSVARGGGRVAFRRGVRARVRVRAHARTPPRFRTQLHPALQRATGRRRLPMRGLPRAPAAVATTATWRAAVQRCPNLRASAQVGVRARRCNCRGTTPPLIRTRNGSPHRPPRQPLCDKRKRRRPNRSPRREQLLPERRSDAPGEQPRSDPRRRALPDRPRTRSQRRARAAPGRQAAARRAGPQRRNGLPGLLRARRPRRLHADRPDARRRLHPQLERRLRSRREHRLGHALAGDSASDRQRLDGLAGPPRQHSRRQLP